MSTHNLSDFVKPCRVTGPGHKACPEALRARQNSSARAQPFGLKLRVQSQRIRGIVVLQFELSAINR